MKQLTPATIAASFVTLLFSTTAFSAESYVTTQPIVVTENSSDRTLNTNKCLQSLSENDKLVVSAAFHDGAGGFRQLEELLAREPWGYVADPVLQAELDTLVKQQSPFLIATMTKKQALLLENHRDLIKWILVQSTEKACA